MSALSKFGRAWAGKARSHEESRLIVCCVCSKNVPQNKDTIKVVSDKWAGLVRQFVFPGYTVHNPLHPTALCAPCRLTLSAMHKVVLRIKYLHYL